MIDTSFGAHLDCAVCGRTYYTEDGNPVCPNRSCQYTAQLPTCDGCDMRMEMETFSGYCDECEMEREEEEEE